MKIRYPIALSILSGLAVGVAVTRTLNAQTRLPAYLIAEIEITNSDAYQKEFGAAAAKFLTEAGGKYLVRGGKTATFDGAAPQRISIIAFESIEKAQAAYSSPAYRDLRKIGDKYAKFRVYAVEGSGQ